MSDKKMRAEFERWISERVAKNGHKHWLQRSPSRNLIDNDSPYRMVWVEAAWQGWQASRAALVVELPKPKTNITIEHLAIGSCRAGIEAAGIKVTS